VLRAALIFVIAFVATLLGSMSGGSSSILMTPSWVALGFPLPVAVAADKAAGAVWTLLGSRNYLRGRPIDRPLLGAMVAVGIVGAFFGTRVMGSVRPDLLKRVVGGLILLMVGVVTLRPHIGAAAAPPRLGRGVVAAAALPLGFYEGLLGSGNSILASLLFSVGRGFDLLASLGHYYILAAAWCAFAAAAYWSQGHMDLTLAAPVTLGALGGGYLGSRIASARGVGFVRGIFVVAGVILALKLLLGR